MAHNSLQEYNVPEKEPRWLDRQLAGRLSDFFGVSPEGAGVSPSGDAVPRTPWQGHDAPAPPIPANGAARRLPEPGGTGGNHSPRQGPGRSPGYPNEPGAFLSGALRLWQWERLCATLLAAARGSLHYRKRLGEAAATAMIRETGGPLARIWLKREAAARAGGAAGGTMPAVSLFTPREAEEAAGGAGAGAEGPLFSLLARLPFTLPEDLAAAPESFLAVPHDAVEGVISLPTSGTTGKGKRIYCSPADLAETAAFFRHGMQYLLRPRRARGGRTDGTAGGRTNGAERADHVALLMSGDRPGSVGDLLLRGMRELGAACSVAGFVPPGQEGEDAMMERLLALEPTCLVGTPAQLFSLSRHAKARQLRVASVLLSGDAMPAALRRGIEAGFGCPVFAHYGLTECGLGGAVECGGRCGCHMREADLLHEIVDGAGRPLPPGEWGEIAITTLTREAMPLLRYRTGDEGRILAEPCACGSVFRRIEVRDRFSRRIPLPDGGQVRGVALDEALFVLPALRGYSVTVHRDAKDRPCGLLVEPVGVPGADADELAAKVRAALLSVPGLEALPVTVRAGEPGGADDPHRTQAKMRVAESRAPFPRF